MKKRKKKFKIKEPKQPKKLMKFILDIIQEDTNKTASQIARDLGITRQLYHSHSLRNSYNASLVNRLCAMYNLPFFKLTKLAMLYEHENKKK